MRFQSLVFILIVLFSLGATNQAIPPGDSIPINIKDPHIIRIAEYAINEQNAENPKVELKLEKIINYVSLIDDEGTSYHLTLSANNGSASNKYEAHVLEKPNETFYLTFFKLIHA
jgi:hypothetical protein